MRYLILSFFLFIIPTLVYSQGFTQVDVKTYTQKEVFDSAYGINIYERLNFIIGGDSVRYDKKGYSCNGWYEDHYSNGQILHKGYYVDGHIRIFKNFYDNGQLERSFRITDLNKSTMEIYYRTGKLKSEINYIKENAVKWQDYYPNGQLEFVEEYNKGIDYLLQHKTFFPDGKPESALELIDQKKKIYTKKEYYSTGQIKEEGQMFFNATMGDYQKDGKWLKYNEGGKLLEESIYVKGELSSTSGK